jgi:SpoVK/Ycf46/Vps4 family AAA+-type ATPase
MNLTNVPQDKHKESDNYYPKEKSHWQKYQIYYLVFGSFFFTTLIILISNSNTNKEIRKLKRQSINNERNQENPDDNNSPGSDDNKPKHEYSSEFIKPRPAEKNENWIQDSIAKESVRKEVETWINSFKYLPEYFAKEGPEIDKHVLLSGPPGTGKTYLAETFCQNEALEYAFVKFDTVLWKGSSIIKQKMALNQAKNILRNEEARQKRLGVKEKIKPVVIVIDELDSVGIKDLSPSNSSSRDEVDGLLRMFDEINNKKLNIIVIGITNYPEALDPALVRPGRLGRKIEVGYPTDEEMDKLMDYLEKEMKGEHGYKFVDNKDKWSKERNNEKVIIKWPDNFWSEVRRITKEIRTKYSKEIKFGSFTLPAGQVNTGFTLRDLEKFVGDCLAAKSGKDIQEIIPSSQDYEAELEKEMKKRIKETKLAYFSRSPKPTPPTKEKEEEI